MTAGHIESILIPASILVLILAICSVVIIKRWVYKKPMGAGSQYMGQNIYMQYQNAEKKHSVEQIMFIKEDERNDNFSADGRDEIKGEDD